MMDNRTFAKHLEKRTLEFAKRMIRLSANLPDSTEGWVIRKQITRSGTSIGANYREANRARSKAEFRSKIRISEGETSETGYWLDIISSMGWGNLNELESHRKECDELLAIFSSIAKNTR